VDSTDGVGELASLDSPMGLVTSSSGQAYWVDAGTGVLRRFDPATGVVDCPLWTDCASGVAGTGSFTNGGTISLVSSDGGVLYALDSLAGTLFRVTP